MRDFNQLAAAAAELNQAQAETGLAQLMQDPRFPAMIRLIRDHRDAVVTAGSAIQVAGSPSAATLAFHYMGAIDALLSLEAQLRGIWEQGS